MTLRAIAFGVVLLVAATFITVGVAMVSTPAALIAAGIQLALIAWLVLSE